MNTITRSCLAIALATTTALTIAACGSSDSSGRGGEDSKTIGVIDFSADVVGAHALYVSSVKAMKAKGWKVLEAQAGGSPDAANTAMQQFVTQDVDAIVPAIFDPSALGSGLAAAKSANIPVFSLAGGLGDGIVAELDATLPAPSGELPLKAASAAPGKVRFLDLTFSPGTPCRLRSAYLKKELAKNPNVTFKQEELAIPGSLQSGESLASSFLSTNPPSDTTLIINTCLADATVGVVSAVKAAKRTDVQIYTNDSSPAVYQDVKNGTVNGMLWPNMSGAGDQFVPLLEEYFADGSVETKSVPLDNQPLDKAAAQDFLDSHPNDPTIS